jgi:acyl-CoA thioesterase-1
MGALPRLLVLALAFACAGALDEAAVSEPVSPAEPRFLPGFGPGAGRAARRPIPVVAPEPISLPGRNLARLPAKVPGVPRVLFLADSVAAGYGLAEDEPPYPTILARRLAAEYGLGIEVLNGGVFGFSTDGGLVLAELGSLQPDIVVVELGGNDYLLWWKPLDRARENLREIITAARGMGAEVLLVGVRLPADLATSERGREFESMYPDLAREFSVRLVPDMFEDALDVPRFMQPDRIHPTAEGQKVVAENILPELRALVQAVAEG